MNSDAAGNEQFLWSLLVSSFFLSFIVILCSFIYDLVFDGQNNSTPVVVERDFPLERRVNHRKKHLFHVSISKEMQMYLAIQRK